jgi:GAF domain-containing protein
LVNVFRFDGELIHLAVVENANVNAEFFAAIHSVFPRPPGRDTTVGRAVLERTTIAIPDVLEDREYGIGTQTLIGGFRSVLGVPLMREEHVIGAIVVPVATRALSRVAGRSSPDIRRSGGDRDRERAAV